MKLLPFLLLITCSLSYGQSDTVLLQKVRSHYYGIQNTFKYLKAFEHCNEVSYYKEKGDVIKIDYQKDDIKEEYYYYHGEKFPCFIYIVKGQKENRYYFDSGDFKDFDFTGTAHYLFRWVDDNKKVRDTSEDHGLKQGWAYLMRGRDLFETVTHEIEISDTEFQSILSNVYEIENKSYEPMEPVEDYLNSEEAEVESVVASSGRVEYLCESESIYKYFDFNQMFCAGGYDLLNYTYEQKGKWLFSVSEDQRFSNMTSNSVYEPNKLIRPIHSSKTIMYPINNEKNLNIIFLELYEKELGLKYEFKPMFEVVDKE